jgi:hypothetical protein
MEQFINENFLKTDFIDFEKLHRIENRDKIIKNLHNKEINKQFSEDSQMVWKFIADKCYIYNFNQGSWNDKKRY